MAEKLSAEDLEGAEEVKAPAAAPPAEDHDLDFLKPGFRRTAPAPAAQPAPGEKLSDDDLAGAEEVAPAAGPEDRIGRANREYQENLSGLAADRAGGRTKNLPQVGTGGALAVGAAQGASLGWGDELAAHADSLISKVPGLRDIREAGANRLFGHPIGALPYDDPSLTYEQRRDAYRDYNEAAAQQHPVAHGVGEAAGGIATAFVPGTSLAKGAGALKVGLQGAALGGLGGAGESEASDPTQIAKESGEGALIGGVGGAALHAGANKLTKALATKIPALADRQAVAALTEGAPKSLTMPMTGDANLSAALNEPIQIAPKKTVTLGQIAGKSAEEVRPIVKAQQERIGQQVAGLLDKSGKSDLTDLANHYDSRIGEYARTPGNAKHINALEDARQEALEHWGPKEEEIEARKGKVGAATDKLYDKADAKSGGVALGDLVAHRDAQIAELSKTPGNQAAVKALEDSKRDIIKSWGTRPVFDSSAVVADGPFKGGTAGDAVAKLEKMAQSRPAQADALNEEAQRIRAAATKDGFDPTVKVPSKAVRAYATKLQNEAATDVADPKLAAKARQLLGSSTKDFVNGHVESVLGPADRKALGGLNGRMSNLYRWPDVVSGKEADPAIRNAVLKEFGQKISPRELDEYASTLEKRGTQRINKLTPGEISDAKESLANATRDFANAHASRNLNPTDLAEYQRLADRRASLKNIDSVLERREGNEQATKTGIISKGLHYAGGIGALHQGATAVAHAVAGDYVGAAKHVAGAIGSAVGPHVLEKTLPAVGRKIVRGAARGTDFLASTVAAADRGNPWATRTLDLLRSTPAGAARLAAAIARMKMASGATAEP
jgi:hypothetical protein